MALYYTYCFIFSLKMAFRAETCCCKLFKMIVNYSSVRLYLLLVYLLTIQEVSQETSYQTTVFCEQLN